MVFNSFLGGVAGGATVSIILQGVDKFSKTFKKANSSMGKLKGSMVTMAVIGATAMAGIGIASLKTAIEFESAFAGVKKTVDLTEAGFEDLENRFKTLSSEIPVSFVELSKIGELAGQLGVEGVNNIEKFTKTIADISVTTNLTQEAAATDFARISNIMGESITNIDKMGASIVDLGNNFATTEHEISSFAQRIAGAATLANLTTSDVFAISAAFTSVGVEAEAGGTAVQKVLNTMIESVAEGGEKLSIFAEISNMTSQQFSKTFKEDASKAFEEFVLGLGRQGDQAFQTLDKLDLKDERLVRSFLSLANAGDLISETLNKSESAWKSNTALVEEAEKRYDTTESKMITLRNQFDLMKNEIGEKLKPAFNDLLEVLDNNSDSMIRFSSEIGTVLVDMINLACKGIKKLDNLLFEMASLANAAITERTINDHERYTDALRAYANEVQSGNMTIEEFIQTFPRFATELILTHKEIGRGIQLLDQKNKVEQTNIAVTEEDTEAIKNNTMAQKDNNKLIEEAIEKRKRFNKLRGAAAEGINIGQTSKGVYYGGGSALGGQAVSGFTGKRVNSVSSVNDFILTNSGKLIETNPMDTIIGTKNPGALGGGGTTIIIKDNNIFGTDPDEIADALQIKLQNMISIT